MERKTHLSLSVNTDEYKERLSSIQKKLEELDKEIEEFNNVNLDFELKQK